MRAEFQRFTVWDLPLSFPEKGGAQQADEIVPVAPLDAAVLAKQPNTADGLRRSDLPAAALALVGGDPDAAPPELIAVLGEPRFRLYGESIAPINSPVYGESGAPIYSPDGKQLAMPCGRMVLLFDAETGQRRRVLLVGDVAGNPYGAGISSTAFNQDGSQLACSFGSGVQLWDVASGRLLHTFHPNEGPNAPRRFSPLRAWPSAPTAACWLSAKVAASCFSWTPSAQRRRASCAVTPGA